MPQSLNSLRADLMTHITLFHYFSLGDTAGLYLNKQISKAMLTLTNAPGSGKYTQRNAKKTEKKQYRLENPILQDRYSRNQHTHKRGNESKQS